MKPLRPVINWNIVASCNYRCSYCVQKHQKPSSAPDETQLEAALAQLTALPQSFEIKISGGEPFLLKRLPDIAQRLAQAGHRVSILTNLSVPLPVLERFIQCAGDALRTFSCSLHREHVDPAQFLTKALAVHDRLTTLPKASFVVNSVVVPGQVRSLGALRKAFESAGLKFYPQLMRTDGTPITYGWLDRWYLRRHFGDLTQPGQINRGYSFTGQPCHAGQHYFIITPRGEAYTCYPGKRTGDGYLGNLFKHTLTLRNQPQPCPYAICPCTVPQNRGIMHQNAETTPTAQMF